ncbi:hypothetical protein [Flavobacterium sp.]|uniref:hypothetical protein n=1 Tax=Flavobacterium sp. TaxID=239 RepID=UPI0025C0354C|nr:hypothetical protein [Flavobacterium sp.]
MIKPSQIIDVLELDNKILSFKTDDDLPIWFLVRYDVCLAILNKNNGFSLAYEQQPLKKAIFKTLFFASIKSPLFIKKGQIVFFNSGVTNVKRFDDKYYFNRVTDHFFFSIKDQALLIEDTASGELKLPRVHNRVFPHLSLLILSKICGFRIKKSNSQNETIEKLIDFICTSLVKTNLKFDIQEIRKIVTANVDAFLSKSSFYDWFLKTKRPKIIFLEDASYGSRSHILLAAKKYKIPVVELQHGFVSEEHIAYHLGKGIEKDEMSKLFYPDFYFAYGQFWKDLINIPSKVVNIGNPYLEEQVNSIKTIPRENNEKTILYLSSAIAVSETIEFICKLKTISDLYNYSIRFRPHPLEQSSVKEKYSALENIGISISGEVPLYNDFSNSDIIIGELSTALFESLALKDKLHFLFMSSYTKSYINDKIKIPQVDGDTIENMFKKQNSSSDISYFWEENWRDNFERELKKI